MGEQPEPEIDSERDEKADRQVAVVAAEKPLAKAVDRVEEGI